MKAYYKNRKGEFVVIDDCNEVGMQYTEGFGDIAFESMQFELQWDKKTRKLILWTDGAIVIKSKNQNTVILNEDEGV